MAEVCPKCDGMGMVVVRRGDGRSAAEPCDCRHEVRVAVRVERARIPKRYQHCSFESYEANFPGADASLAAAHLMARRFVDGYPVTTEGQGLLLTGSIGVGKTHLAVGILQSLIIEKGVRGLFCDYRELLKEIQHSYNPQVLTTELEILRPVFEAEVLVLDELGASKPTEWVWDTVAHILNTRYNDKRTTVITTNFPSLPAGSSLTRSERTLRGEAQEVMRDKTLGDRIGDRMQSRLAEMCVIVQMFGKDFRQDVRRARFG
jgi:DNA replication protein DnaC